MNQKINPILTAVSVYDSVEEYRENCVRALNFGIKKAICENFGTIEVRSKAREQVKILTPVFEKFASCHGDPIDAVEQMKQISYAAIDQAVETCLACVGRRDLKRCTKICVEYGVQPQWQ